jgi:hypothetical protein
LDAALPILFWGRMVAFVTQVPLGLTNLDSVRFLSFDLQIRSRLDVISPRLQFFDAHLF